MAQSDVPASQRRHCQYDCSSPTEQQQRGSCCNCPVCYCCFSLFPAERSRLNVGSGDAQQQGGLIGRHLSKSASDLSTSQRDDHDKVGERSALVQTSTTQAHSTSNVPQVAHKTHHSFFSTLKVNLTVLLCFAEHVTGTDVFKFK
jgi:hypothetical protein